jgi:DNA-binding NarL/FixJ family response regulator
VIVGRDAIVRRALVAELRTEGIALAAETACPRDAIDLAVDLAPAVAIVDRDVPDDDDVLELVQRMHRAAPEVAILLLSNGVDDDFAILALQAGASGFVCKRLPLEILPRVVHSLAAGDAAVSRSLTMRLIDLLRHPDADGAGLRSRRTELSAREAEVLDLICAGDHTPGTAARLGLPVETVRSDVERILRKIGAPAQRSRSAAR